MMNIHGSLPIGTYMCWTATGMSEPGSIFVVPMHIHIGQTRMRHAKSITLGIPGARDNTQLVIRALALPLETLNSFMKVEIQFPHFLLVSYSRSLCFEC